jgi:hypothetical protein
MKAINVTVWGHRIEYRDRIDMVRQRPTVTVAFRQFAAGSSPQPRRPLAVSDIWNRGTPDIIV